MLTSIHEVKNNFKEQQRHFGQNIYVPMFHHFVSMTVETGDITRDTF